MKPDRNTVKKMLALSDEELLAVIEKLCRDNNIDTSRLGLSKGSIGILRGVLQNAGERDIERFLSVLGNGGGNGR